MNILKSVLQENRIMFSNTSHSFALKQMRPRRRNNFITVFILGCIIFIFLLAYLAYGTESITDPTLKQIHVLFRHGERTPSSSYPTDPHQNYKWSDGFGSLTNEGKLGMYNFGEVFRKRYGNFLGELFLTKDISILSSYAPRCQMSAMTFFAGLFPPVSEQVWNEKLHWQPILVNPIPRNIDNLIAAKAPCKSFTIQKGKSDDALHANLTEKDRNLFKYLSENTGSFINNIDNVERLYSTLMIEEHNGLYLPNWAKSVYPEPMKTLAAMNLASFTMNPVLKRLQGGPLLKQWIDNMKSLDKKAYFYSGHDLTIVNLMRTFGITGEYFLPDYGATFILELHLVENEKIIKALYYNSSKISEPISLNLPSCESHHCPLESLIEHLKPNIPDDWAKECNFVV